MRIRNRPISVLLSLLALSSASVVQAQTAASTLNAAQGQGVDLFARDRNVSVRERPRPEYEALGLSAGTFAVYPLIQIDAENSDNVFATAIGEQNDWIVHFKPEVAIESGWSRHSLSAYARADIARYQDFDGENHEDWDLGANGRLDITRATNVAAGFNFASQTEPRTSSNAPASTREPVRYDLTSSYLAASHVSGRVKVSARGDIREFDYEDGVTLAGVVVDQDNRDRTLTSLTGRADLAISPATALFVQATTNKRDYDTAVSAALPARDSDGYEILAGANFEVGAVMRGEIAAGYIVQEFDAAVYDQIDGFGARAQLEWFPTQLTTVTAYGSRTIEDSGIVGSGGYLSSSAGVRIDHELMRNVLLNAEASLSRDEYEGIDREDERVQLSVGGTYLMNRNLGLSLSASRFEQTSSGLAGGAEFDVNRLTATLVAQF
ncbi:outer membrane beta-barrel protein [Brevundimonas bacteroides]|uniref:outer membrane beta-barrel protein n=1 Tax=Brevundimonas bacteroides TaxID=74311 RepID=UPI0004963B35|nr:outer membrane beta-barrel protein [Brevundimonas bacteroides]